MQSLIDILYNAHCDNSRQQYYAKRFRGQTISIMPLTPFVFEFFLFNSLYQVDWENSFVNGTLSYHPDDYGESKQQAEFVKFIRTHARKKPADLYRAYEPLLYLPKADGEWTKVTPDSRISVAQGESFFRKILEFQTILEKCNTPDEMPTSNKVFELIDKARYFIYLVRNNIFHGSKSLGEAYETNQRKRIEVYDLFLKGLTSMFFLAVGKPSVASDFVPGPILASALPDGRDGEILDQNTVWTALNRGLMKMGDSRLISQFTKQIPPSNQTPSERSALFYPSAGVDMLTPLLLGLPYCREFYFYEKRQRQHAPAITNVLARIPTIRLRNQARTPGGWEQQSNHQYLELEYAGLLRRIYWICSDNLDFLQADVELAFYFHRGDSWGEGGSGQQWDSKLLPELMKKIPAGKECIFLTDGEPGGVDQQPFNVLNFPFLERGRRYYYGSLSGEVKNGV